ncbi:hypothetical protein FRC07_011728, partial [Ceratobasidium sp. 392]
EDEYMLSGSRDGPHTPERKLLYIPGLGSGGKGLSNTLVQLFGAAAGLAIIYGCSGIREGLTLLVKWQA